MGNGKTAYALRSNGQRHYAKQFTPRRLVPSLPLFSSLLILSHFSLIPRITNAIVLALPPLLYLRTTLYHPPWNSSHPISTFHLSLPPKETNLAVDPSVRILRAISSLVSSLGEEAKRRGKAFSLSPSLPSFYHSFIYIPRTR